MKRFIVVVALFAAACSSDKLPTSPTDNGPVLVSTHVTAHSTSGAGVVFDATQLGRVTITNVTDVTAVYTYIVWDATDEVNQVEVAATSATIQPGTAQVLTVGFTEQCGVKYQRDVYLNLPTTQSGHYTLSDVGPYFYAAAGYYWQEAPCGGGNTPPVVPPPHCTIDCAPPPVDVCPNLEGLQLSVPQGFILVGGVCLPIIQPPPPPSCGPFAASGPITVAGLNGEAGATAYVRATYSPFLSPVHPSGHQNAGNNHSSFTFTATANYAVVVFHQTGGGNNAVDIIYTGVTIGQSIVVQLSGADEFFFNCSID